MRVQNSSVPDADYPESIEADLLARALAVAVYRAGVGSVRRLESDVLRPLGLSSSGYSLLMRLWLIGPMQPREIARIQCVAVPSVTSLVNTLERRGLVMRERVESDGRLVSVSITDAGIELARAAQLRANPVESLVASALSKQEQEVMLGYLNRYSAALGDQWREDKEESQAYGKRYRAAAAGEGLANPSGPLPARRSGIASPASS